MAGDPIALFPPKLDATTGRSSARAIPPRPAVGDWPEGAASASDALRPSVHRPGLIDSYGRLVLLLSAVGAFYCLFFIVAWAVGIAVARLVEALLTAVLP